MNKVESLSHESTAVMLAEYQNAVQLYNTALTVGYQRILALLALHGGLLIAALSDQPKWETST